MAAADETEKKSTLREYYEALLIAVIFVNFARIFVFQAFKIPTGSMEDNLKVGDHIIVNKFIYGPNHHPLGRFFPIRDIERGDIIVFRYPKDPSVDYVKRVVGLPGETVEIRDKKVFIDGNELDEPYTLYVDSETIYPDNPALPDPYRSRDQHKATVPPGHYFAMGDNRDRSADSRYWGAVPRALIKGRAFMVYWSFEGGRTAPPGAPLSARLRELWHVVKRFLPDTRWHRTFYVVDSKYHYTPGTSANGDE
jgi:signal peptidase I